MTYSICEKNGYKIGYKVVRDDLKSLGLSSTNIVQYHQNIWNEYDENGIWSARIPSFATYIRSYMKEAYGIGTRTFVVAVDGIIDVTSNGIKSKKILFLEELADLKTYDVSKVVKRNVR